jgi:hypothetical protein
LAPFGKGGGAFLLEDIAAVEVAVMIEMVMNGSVDRSEFLQRLNVPEFRHRPFPSPERLVGIFRPIVVPSTTVLFGRITDHIQRRPV